MKTKQFVFLLLAIIAMGACALWSPKHSADTTRILITRNTPDISGHMNVTNTGGYDPYFNRRNFLHVDSPTP